MIFSLVLILYVVAPLIQGFLSGIDALLPSKSKQNPLPGCYPSPFISVSRVQQIVSKPQAVGSSLSDESTIGSSLSEDESTTIPSITQKFQTITSNPNICIVIDVENVRGKTSFELDHADLLDRLLVWSTLRGYASGRTIVVVDHGSKSSAHLLKCHDTSSCNDDCAICVSFAGPGNIKADDVIARDVRWLLSTKEVDHVTVITADQELAWRCRSAAPRQTNENGSSGYNSIMRSLAANDKNGFGPNPKRGGRKKKGNKQSRSARKRQYKQAIEEPNEDVDEIDEISANSADVAKSTATTIEEEQSLPTVEIIAPQRFLEDLEYAMHEWLDQQEKDIETDHISINNIPIPKPISTLQGLFKLKGRILTIESTLRKKCTLHKRQTLTGELRLRKKEWRDILKNAQSSDLASTLAWSLSSTISSINDEDEDDNKFLSSPSVSTPMTWDELSKKEQDKLLLRWGKHRGRHGTKREKTEDRIVLAERLRRQLELLVPSEPPTAATSSLASEYAEYINNQL